MNYISFVFHEGTKQVMDIFFLIFIITTVLATLLLLYLSFMFHKEGEKVAFNKSISLTIFIFIIWLFIYTAEIEIVFYIITAVVGLTYLLYIVPSKINPKFTDDNPKEKYDERDIMFSRS